MSDQSAAAPPQAAAADSEAECPRCRKPPALCVCAGIVPIDNKVTLMILQHPQEQDRELGTARLAALQFKRALFKIGLSWPSLSKILGRPAEPQRWAVLYLGSLKAQAQRSFGDKTDGRLPTTFFGMPPEVVGPLLGTQQQNLPRPPAAPAPAR